MRIKKYSHLYYLQLLRHSYLKHRMLDIVVIYPLLNIYYSSFRFRDRENIRISIFLKYCFKLMWNYILNIAYAYRILISLPCIVRGKIVRGRLETGSSCVLRKVSVLTLVLPDLAGIITFVAADFRFSASLCLPRGTEGAFEPTLSFFLIQALCERCEICGPATSGWKLGSRASCVPRVIGETLAVSFLLITSLFAWTESSKFGSKAEVRICPFALKFTAAISIWYLLSKADPKLVALTIF